MRLCPCTSAHVLCVPDETMYRRPVRKLLCQAAYSVVEQASIVACENLSASMQLTPYHYRDTHRGPGGWEKDDMADTLTLMSLCRISVPALVSPACISQTGFRTGQLQRRTTRPLSTRSEVPQSAGF